MTNLIELTPKASARLQHVEGNFLSSSVDRTLDVFLSGTGSVDCLLSLGSHAAFGAVYCWFRNRDIEKTRNWAWASGLLALEWWRIRQERVNPGIVFRETIYPLISNHRGLIQAFGHSQDFMFLHKIDDPGRMEFLLFQVQLAMLGDLSRLRQRAELAVQSGRTPRGKLTFRADYDFFLHLGREDPVGMERAVQTLLRPRMLVARNSLESGVVRDLVSTPAVIYCKLAALNGMPLDIDHPMVPREWLSDEPPAHYVFPFPFSLPVVIRTL